jgi:hypothetical protein
LGTLFQDRLLLYAGDDKGDRRIYWGRCAYWHIKPVLFEGGRDDAGLIADAVATLFLDPIPYSRTRQPRRTQRPLASSPVSV